MIPSVTVVGSVHMDLVATASRLPARGETVTGEAFSMQPGGKGGNQAVQVARCGVRSCFVGCIGDDFFGRQLEESLRNYGVNTTYLRVDASTPSGASTVLVGEAGDYGSIVVLGAGSNVSTEDIDLALPALGESQILLAQLELSAPTVIHAVKVAKALGQRIVLNAAPAPADWTSFPRSFWTGIDVLIVNQVEAAALSGMRADDAVDVNHAAIAIAESMHVGAVVVTAGAAGAVLVSPSRVTRYPAWPVHVVNTIGAGDAFTGTLAAALAGGTKLDLAMPRAIAAASIAVTRAGAYDGLPSGDEVEAFLNARDFRERAG